MPPVAETKVKGTHTAAATALMLWGGMIEIPTVKLTLSHRNSPMNWGSTI
jgi:hypothetical protein